MFKETEKLNIENLRRLEEIKSELREFNEENEVNFLILGLNIGKEGKTNVISLSSDIEKLFIPKKGIGSENERSEEFDRLERAVFDFNEKFGSDYVLISEFFIKEEDKVFKTLKEEIKDLNRRLREYSNLFKSKP